jgi:hypothetical protein
MYIYLNFLCLKQIILQMYFDLTFSHARKAESLQTLNLSLEKEVPKEFSVFYSLYASLKYTVVDAVLISILVWLAGGSALM